MKYLLIGKLDCFSGSDHAQGWPEKAKDEINNHAVLDATEILPWGVD